MNGSNSRQYRNLSTNSQRRPRAEQYRKMRQQAGFTNTQMNRQKRPTAEQYRKIREERGQKSNNQYRNSNTNN